MPYVTTAADQNTASAIRIAKLGYWNALGAFVTWFGMGVESILRPFQDNRRETFWPVPFVFTVACFLCIHLLHRGRSRIERHGFVMVAVASALVLLGNIGLQLHIAPLEKLQAPLGVVVWLVGLVCFGAGILFARILPKSAGWAIILLEPASVLAAVLLLPVAPMLERGAYSGNIGKGISMGIVALALKKVQDGSRSDSLLRILGVIGMLGAPGLLVEECIRRACSIGDFEATTATSVAGLVYVIGWMASTIGLRRMRATGAGYVALAVFVIQMAGLFLAGAQQVIELSGSSGVRSSTFYRICDSAWPLSHLFMIVVGGMVIAGSRIKGPSRFAALACGLTLPLSIALRALNHTASIFSMGLFTTLCFTASGLTVFRAERAKTDLHGDTWPGAASVERISVSEVPSGAD